MDWHCSTTEQLVDKNMTSANTISFALQTIGITLTILTLALLLLTCALHREWRQTFKNQLLVQLMISRFVHVLTRYVYDTARLLGLKYNGDSWICYDVLLFVYFELAVSSWMFVFTKNMHDDLVKVMTIKKSHRLLKASLVCWLAPLPPSFVGSVFYSREPSLKLYVYLLYCIVKWPILIANGCILLKIINSLRKDSKESKNNRKVLVVMLYLLFVFCFQHFCSDIYKLLFLVLKDGHEIDIVKILFHICYVVSMYQCSYAIMFWLFFNKNTRQFWRKIVCARRSDSTTT